MRTWVWNTFVMLACCMNTLAYAEPVLQRQLTYDYMEDDSIDAACPEYLHVTIQRDGHAVTRDICEGGRVIPVISGDDEIWMIDKKGGNAAGWGLYRYNVTKDVLELYDFNAREIYVGQRGYDGVELTVMHSDYDTENGGYKPDKVTRWFWRFDKAHPTKE